MTYTERDFSKLKEKVSELGLTEDFGNQQLLRFDQLIFKNAEMIKGKRILELGPATGRFSRLMAQLGAEKVTCIEARKDCLSDFNFWIEKDRIDPCKIDLVHGYISDLEKHFKPEEFDTVFIAGVFHHLDQHVELLRACERLKISYLILDSIYRGDENTEPLLYMFFEKADEDPGFGIEPGKDSTIVCTPSVSAIEMMLKHTNWKILRVHNFRETPVDGFVASIARGKRIVYICEQI